MRWGRRREEGRSAPTSADPVADALARLAGPLVPRYPDEEPVLAELPRWIEASDSAEIDGYDTKVWLDDEIALYCDPYEDGLEQAIAEQPGITDLLAEDREIVFLRTRLSLPDVTAAVVRAVVEVNRVPRTPST